MTLRLVQAGSGPRRPLVLAFFIANRAALLASLPPSACVIIDLDNPAGRFTRPVGHGGVDSLDDVKAFARAHAGADDVGPVILIGWSAGCEAVREQLRAGAEPDATLALDGTSGDVPPSAAQLEPWRDAADAARAGDRLLVLTHTLQTYTEHLPPAQRFLSTLSGCRLITGWPLLDAGPIGSPVIAVEEGLVVASYRSATIDGAAHVAQQQHALPDLLARIVMPWLVEHGYELPDGAPSTTPDNLTIPAGSTERSKSSSSVWDTGASLRVGTHGPAITEWQAILRMRGYPVAADGTFGEATAAATRALQRRFGLTVDGVVGPKTRAAAEACTGEDEPPATEPAPVVVSPADAPLPALTEAQKDAIFGVVAWVPDEPPVGQIRITNGYRARLEQIEIPELRGVPYAPASGVVVMHRDVCQPLADLFQAWREAGLMHLVRAWSGGLAFRRVRGGALLSSHARGIAFDINAPGLPLGRKDPGAGKPWSVAELAPIAQSMGWFWGNDFERPDPMHYEKRAL